MRLPFDIAGNSRIKFQGNVKLLGSMALKEVTLLDEIQGGQSNKFANVGTGHHLFVKLKLGLTMAFVKFAIILVERKIRLAPKNINFSIDQHFALLLITMKFCYSSHFFWIGSINTRTIDEPNTCIWIRVGVGHKCSDSIVDQSSDPDRNNLSDCELQNRIVCPPYSSLKRRMKQVGQIMSFETLDGETLSHAQNFSFRDARLAVK